MDPHHLQQFLQQQQLLRLQPQHHHHPIQPLQFPPHPLPYYQHPQFPQQNAYHQSNLYPHSAMLRPPEPTPPGVNPVAVAVQSLLVQYSEAVGSQWNTPPMVGQLPYRGTSEVAGELLRGHQGNFGCRGPHPSFVGGSHGRGRGGGYLFSVNGVPSTSSHPHQTYQPSVTLTPQKSDSAPALKTEVPNYQKPQVAQKTMAVWCEVCKASCTDLDVLKQHQSGRRHQRNLRKMQQLKNGIGTRAKLGGQQRFTSNTKLEVPHQTQCGLGGEEKNTTKNMPSEPGGYKNSRETGKQNKNPRQPEIPPGDGSDNVKRGKKRKKTRTAKQHVEPSKCKVGIPIVCDLCNVKCESQEFFKRHLSGKKHFAKYRQVNGHEPMHGPVGLQVLYPPTTVTETVFKHQEGRYLPPHVYQDIPVETSSDPQFQQNPVSEGSECAVGCGSSSTVTTASETNIKTELEISQQAVIKALHLNGNSETGPGFNTFSHDSLESDKREQTNFREDVNELTSTTEQPRGDGLGKDQIMEYFINNTRVVVLPPAIQRDLDEMKASNLGYKVLADQILKYLMIIVELEPIVQRDVNEIEDAFTKLVTRIELIHNMLKQVEVLAGSFSGRQIHTHL